MRGIALDPRSGSAENEYYNRFQLARIYILVGESEKALDELETLLKNPGYLSRGG
jgi:thioredoxin-like negative regulator of GroEL